MKVAAAEKLLAESDAAQEQLSRQLQQAEQAHAAVQQLLEQAREAASRAAEQHRAAADAADSQRAELQVASQTSHLACKRQTRMILQPCNSLIPICNPGSINIGISPENKACH